LSSSIDELEDEAAGIGAGAGIIGVADDGMLADARDCLLFYALDIDRTVLNAPMSTEVEHSEDGYNLATCFAVS
jgi:hypothetical protein